MPSIWESIFGKKNAEEQPSDATSRALGVQSNLSMLPLRTATENKGPLGRDTKPEDTARANSVSQLFAQQSKQGAGTTIVPQATNVSVPSELTPEMKVALEEGNNRRATDSVKRILDPVTVASGDKEAIVEGLRREALHASENIGVDKDIGERTGRTFQYSAGFGAGTESIGRGTVSLLDKANELLGGEKQDSRGMLIEPKNRMDEALSALDVLAPDVAAKTRMDIDSYGLRTGFIAAGQMTPDILTSFVPGIGISKLTRAIPAMKALRASGNAGSIMLANVIENEAANIGVNLTLGAVHGQTIEQTMRSIAANPSSLLPFSQKRQFVYGAVADYIAGRATGMDEHEALLNAGTGIAGNIGARLQVSAELRAAFLKKVQNGIDTLYEYRQANPTDIQGALKMTDQFYKNMDREAKLLYQKPKEKFRAEGEQRLAGLKTTQGQLLPEQGKPASKQEVRDAAISAIDILTGKKSIESKSDLSPEHSNAEGNASSVMQLVQDKGLRSALRKVTGKNGYLALEELDPESMPALFAKMRDNIEAGSETLRKLNSIASSFQDTMDAQHFHDTLMRNIDEARNPTRKKSTYTEVAEQIQSAMDKQLIAPTEKIVGDVTAKDAKSILLGEKVEKPQDAVPEAVRRQEELDNQMGLVKTLLADRDVSAITKQKLEAMNTMKSDETHAKNNKLAEEVIASDPVYAEAYVRSQDTPFNQIKSTLSLKLIDHYDRLSASTTDPSLKNQYAQKAAELSLAAADQALGAGRGIQAIWEWMKNRPGAVVRIMNKLVENAKEKDASVESLSKDQIAKIYNLASEMKSTSDPKIKSEKMGKILDIVAENVKPSFWDKLDAYRYSNMLLAPLSVGKGLVTNLQQVFLQRPATLFVENFDFYNLLTRGKSDGLKAVSQHYKEVFNAFHTAVLAARDVVAGKSLIENIDLSTGSMEASIKQRSIHPALQIAGKLYEAVDKFGETLLIASEYKRTGDLEGATKTAKELLARTQKFDAETHAKLPTISRGIDNMYNWFASGRSSAAGRWTSWVIPFMKTATRMAQLSVEFSPLGFADSRVFTGKMNKEMVARAAVGSMVSLFATQAVMSGRMTTGVPSDTKERELFYAMNKKPWSLKVGDRYYSLAWFGTLGLAMALPAIVNEAFSKDRKAISDSTLEHVAKIGLDIFQFIGTQLPIQNVSVLARMLGGDDSLSLGKTAAFTAEQLVPLASMLRWVGKINDPVVRQVADGWELFLRDSVPGYSTTLTPYTKPNGEEQTRSMLDVLTPFGGSLPEDTRFKDEAEARQMELQLNAVQNKGKKWYDKAHDFYKQGRKDLSDKILTDHEKEINLYEQLKKVRETFISPIDSAIQERRTPELLRKKKEDLSIIINKLKEANAF